MVSKLIFPGAKRCNGSFSSSVTSIFVGICIFVISVEEHVARRQRGAMVRSAPPYFLRLPGSVRGQNILFNIVDI